MPYCFGGDKKELVKHYIPLLFMTIGARGMRTNLLLLPLIATRYSRKQDTGCQIDLILNSPKKTNLKTSYHEQIFSS